MSDAVPKAVLELLDYQARTKEEMTLALMSVKRPEWDIINIQSLECWGVAFVPHELNKPPCFEPVKEIKDIEAVSE